MAKEQREKQFLVGAVWNYVAELKLLLIALLILCTLATFLQLIPSRFIISTSDLRFCITRFIQEPPPTSYSASLSHFKDQQQALPPHIVIPLSPVSPSVEQDRVLGNGIIKRTFNPYGAAAYNFITMSAYRGGLSTFATVGLASKPLHVYGKPTYQCQWLNQSSFRKPISAVGYKILPDWGYGRVYTVVVVNCTFPEPINVDNSGGKLVLYASKLGSGDKNLTLADRMEVLTELPGSMNASRFTSSPKYEYLYCGSSLYGNLNAQRIREWIAFHVKLFGLSSHFVIYDAGGVHEQVLEVLKPWMELGYVTVHDVREQERFDGYYHNQFMVVNDCLHRYKFMAKWMFFFDVDEYIYIHSNYTIKSILDSLSEFSQFTIEQMPMSSRLCLSEDAAETPRKWGFEKLVYKDVKRGIRRDRKYAVQPRNVYATGVHLSQNLAGKTTHNTDGRIKYFHYHGTIAESRELCRTFINDTDIVNDKIPYVKDTTMRAVAHTIKEFELKMIGSRLHKTRL